MFQFASLDVIVLTCKTAEYLFTTKLLQFDFVNVIMHSSIFLVSFLVLQISRISLGRPFVVNGKSRTTFSQTCNKDVCSNRRHADSWKMGPPPSISENSSYNQEIGRRWLEQAEAEHASIAAFARNTLYLMHLGSTAGLLMTSQEAGMEKINHTKLSYGIATTFIGHDLAPGPLNVDGCLDEVDLKIITRSVVLDGCIEDTILAIETAQRANSSEDLAIKSALNQMAWDNAKHAQYAWDTLEWIIEKFPEIRGFVLETLKIELERNLQNVECHSLKKEIPSTCTKPGTDSEEITMFRKYGLMTEDERINIRQTVMKKAIEPVYKSGLKKLPKSITPKKKWVPQKE